MKRSACYRRRLVGSRCRKRSTVWKALSLHERSSTRRSSNSGHRHRLLLLMALFFSSFPSLFFIFSPVFPTSVTANSRENDIYCCYVTSVMLFQYSLVVLYVPLRFRAVLNVLFSLFYSVLFCLTFLTYLTFAFSVTLTSLFCLLFASNYLSVILFSLYIIL